jgi:hypothetical protein
MIAARRSSPESFTDGCMGQITVSEKCPFAKRGMAVEASERLVRAHFSKCILTRLHFQRECTRLNRGKRSMAFQLQDSINTIRYHRPMVKAR